MTAIFNHVDDAGDELYVAPQIVDGLTVLGIHTNGDLPIRLDRHAALRLHLALGEWLHPQDLGPTNGQLADAVPRLADAMDAAATAVRPLWGQSKDVGTYVDAYSVPADQVQSQVPKQVITPKCSLCDKPWSSNHGQDVEPCTPSAERQAELWQAEGTPTAPGCTECGHPYRKHEGVTRCLGGPVGNWCECIRYRSAP